MTKMQMRAGLGLHLAMTPQLLQSIRLLQLSRQELEQELRAALDTNVLLEDAAETPDADEETPVGVQADAAWEWREAASHRRPQDEDGEGWEARLAAPEPQDARLAALAQLQLVVRTPRQAALVAALLDAIDDNGYLTQPLEAVAPACGLAPPPDEAELEAALALVQGVEPTGFGARDLRECLLLQLRARPGDTPGRDLAEFIVCACLDRLARGDCAGLQEALGIGAGELQAAVSLIRSLDPRPAHALAAPAQAVEPDVVVGGRAGAWSVGLVHARLPRLRVNPVYERALAGNGGHAALREQLQAARGLVRGLQVRHDTLLRTARAIFARQSAFLERGEEAMVPLTLRDVAADLGLHESTVCRVTAQKWAQTPWGTYPLKAFFPSQLAAGGGEASGTAVKAMIRRIVDGESRHAPLCDGDIAAILARNGVRVARRTVGKYREAMRIPQARERDAARLPGAARA